MDQVAPPLPVVNDEIAAHPRTFLNFSRYILARLATVLGTAVIAVYITIIIANFGGYVDEIIKSNIDDAINGMVMGGWLKDTPTEEKFAIIEQTTLEMQDAAGLNQPFLLRTFRWLWDGITLNWGDATRPYNSSNLFDLDVRSLIAEHLSRSAFIFGTTNVLVFFVTVAFSLALTRRYGSWLDRLFVTLSPLSAAPAWIYGVFLSIFLLRFFAFSTGGTLDKWPTEFDWAFVPILLRHLFPVILAVFISTLFQGVYAWRTFFLIYSSEDYVDLAQAKGLSPRLVERRYILRPALPGIITSFALMTMALWQEIIALEFFFNVEGMGRLFITALKSLDTPMVVGLVVTFAYLLAITVFLLDIVYALIDPRIRMGENNSQAAVTAKPRRARFWQRKSKPKQQPVKAAVPTPGLGLSNWSLNQLAGWLWRQVSGLGHVLRQLVRYPTAVLGLLIILGLTVVSIYALTTTSSAEVISLWRGEGNVWVNNPRNALPTWVNYFRKNDLPETIVLDSHEQSKEVSALSAEMTEINYTLSFAYRSGDFPQDVVLNFDAEFAEKAPFLTINWLTPDGRDIELYNAAVRSDDSYHLTQDERLQRKLGGLPVQKALFLPADSDTGLPLKGVYTLQISGLVFEEDSDINTELVLYGQVYGLAGTDANRRDLTVALLWGTPIALAFGLIAAVVTSVIGMILAAIGAWYGGWVDKLVQFFTEVNLVLPFFPISLMIYILYSKSIWFILGVTVILSVFSNSIKTYRATFLQIKETPYIEAARAYGASDWRIIIQYLMPRIMSILVPKLVILVPSYVFLEATLAFLGVSDPVLPTWGKLVVAALNYGIPSRAYHMVVASLLPLILTSFAFAMVGIALEKVFEPRLREN